MNFKFLSGPNNTDILKFKFFNMHIETSNR